MKINAQYQVLLFMKLTEVVDSQVSMCIYGKFLKEEHVPSSGPSFPVRSFIYYSRNLSSRKKEH